MLTSLLFHIILIPFGRPPIASSRNKYCNITIIVFNPDLTFSGKLKGLKRITMFNRILPFMGLPVLQDHFRREINAFYRQGYLVPAVIDHFVLNKIQFSPIRTACR